MTRITVVVGAVVFVLATFRLDGAAAEDGKPESDEEISKRLREPQPGAGLIQVHGKWGDAVVVLGYSASDPPQWTVYAVDLAARKARPVVIPELRQILALGHAGRDRVALGLSDAGGWRLRQETLGKWEDVPLPPAVEKAKTRRLIRSDGALAVAIPEAVYRWIDKKWLSTPLPDVPERPSRRDKSNDVVVKSCGLLLGSTYYIGWRDWGDTNGGGLLSIDLDAREPAWRPHFGTKDPAKGVSTRYAVSALVAGPDGHLWVAVDNEWMLPMVYEFDGNRWHERLDLFERPDEVNRKLWGGNFVSDLRDVRLDAKGTCHLLGADGIFALKEGKLTRLAPGPLRSTDSLYIDAGGSLLVGGTRTGLLLLEKVGTGYRLHRLTLP